MPCLKKCCCCCDLRTGGMVLGWFGLIGGILMAATCTGILFKLDDIVPRSDDQKALNMFGKVAGGINTEDYVNVDENHALRNGLYFGMIGWIVASLITILSNTLLLCGSSTGNRFLLVPWLVLGMMSLIIEAPSCLAGGIILLDSVPAAGIFTLAIGLPVLGLHLYFWLCVLSLFQDMRGVPGLVYRTPGEELSRITGACVPPAYEPVPASPIA